MAKPHWEPSGKDFINEMATNEPELGDLTEDMDTQYLSEIFRTCFMLGDSAEDAEDNLSFVLEVIRLMKEKFQLTAEQFVAGEQAQSDSAQAQAKRREALRRFRRYMSNMQDICEEQPDVILTIMGALHSLVFERKDNKVEEWDLDEDKGENECKCKDKDKTFRILVEPDELLKRWNKAIRELDLDVPKEWSESSDNSPNKVPSHQAILAREFADLHRSVLSQHREEKESWYAKAPNTYLNQRSRRFAYLGLKAFNLKASTSSVENWVLATPDE